MAWKHDCGLRSAHFLHLFKAMLRITLQSILVSYAKIHFQQLSKLLKATEQISQITEDCSSPPNTLPCTTQKEGGKKKQKTVLV